MTTPVKPDPASTVLSFEEWQQRQYAPHRSPTDPNQPMGLGRVLTFDEWDQARRTPDISTLKLPAMPRFQSDVTRTPSSDQTKGTPISNPIIGPIMRQIVDPMLEHPIEGAAFGALAVPGVAPTLAAAAPLTSAAAGIGLAGMSVYNIARYGWEKAHELAMSPEERAIAEANPDRVSGESAAMQALMLGLAPLIHLGVKRFRAGANVPTVEGVTPSAINDVPQPSKLLESPQGADLLGRVAAQSGLPETASPYKPASPEDVAWKAAHAETTGKPAEVPATEVAPTVTPPAEQAPSAVAEPTITPAPEPLTGTLQPIEGTGPVRTRGLAAGVEQKAIASDLTRTLGDLPEYRTVNMADQAAKASDLFASDPARARRIALGDEHPPTGIIPEAVFKVVEDRAIQEGDVATLRDLANGGLTTEATTMGQRIRALRERNPDSPVSAIQSVEDVRARGKNIEPEVQNAMADLRSHLDAATALDPKAWEFFINSIRC